MLLKNNYLPKFLEKGLVIALIIC